MGYSHSNPWLYTFTPTELDEQIWKGTKLFIFDATYGADALEKFKLEAIKGARFFYLPNFKDPTGTYSNTFPTKEIVQDKMKTLGFDVNDIVVFYE